MIEKDPDESVLNEQSEATEKASGNEGTENSENTENAEKAETPEKPETPESTEKSESEGELPDADKKTEEEPVKEKKASRRTRTADSDKHEESRMEIQDIDDIDLPPVDYSGYTKNELVETLNLITDNRPPSEIRDDVDRIKAFFYRKLKQEADERKNKFIEGGGKIEDYRSWVDPSEAVVKHLLEKYKEKKSDYNKIQEAEKYENLKKKYEIIDKIKELVNREESINKTFHEFRSLQNEWHSVGVVPQSALKDLWENYHHNVEIFYDYIKINKELKDLDLKKNLEAKVLLCEKAEELLLEPNAVIAFRTLQDLHNQWREIGPVTQESKNEIWERFREATSQINKRHHEYFEKQKDDQRKNLEAKITMCEEVEAINLLEIKNFRDFDEKAEKVVALQKMWRTIGFAPKKQNNKVYQRFRDACDAFFEKKRAFYSDNKEIQQNNLQRKIDLCLQAEALQESTDWKATSDALINLQKDWKDIGPVPRKQSEKCWKRFRKACDHFFNRKTEFFNELDTSYEDNLKAKIAVIEELEAFEPGDDVHAAFDRLKEIQKKWTDIGFVPFNKKDEITNRYRNALNKEFDKLKIADEDKNILKYRTKLDNLKTNPKASRKIHNEREKFFTKIKQLEGDIVLWENNIGFFAKSTNADTMIREVQEKIENARKMIKTLEEKVKMIDQSGLDD
ncbi:MAG: DUF349 domain-containing protein [Bacteroidales bacterium]|jgi:hypothetical protein